MTIAKLQTEIPGRSKSDAIMLELLFRHAVLMEHQLGDLRSSVRQFVDTMSESLVKLDAMVTEEGVQANALYEGIYDESEKEAKILNKRANARVDDILAETLAESPMEMNISEELKNAVTNSARLEDNSGIKNINAEGGIESISHEAKDAVWSMIAKKLESVTRLEERLRPQVYSIISSLNFEDIQSQRLEHLLSGYKLLNEGVIKYLQTGHTDNEPEVFANGVLSKIKSMYTMEEERRIFDNIFPSKKC